VHRLTSRTITTSGWVSFAIACGSRYSRRRLEPAAGGLRIAFVAAAALVAI
jgi:hypothetical protein